MLANHMSGGTVEAANANPTNITSTKFGKTLSNLRADRKASLLVDANERLAKQTVTGKGNKALKKRLREDGHTGAVLNGKSKR